MMERILRLSFVQAEILSLLITRGEMYGLEMVSESKRLKRGSIYVTLGRMADKGLITSRTMKTEHEPGLPRRLFSPTAYGARAFRAYEAAAAVLSEALV